MDPRHPELALPRVKELIEQLENNFSEIEASTVKNRMGELERKGALIVQEICLTAPRLHETLMLVARERRGKLAKWLYEDNEVHTAHNQAETTIVEPKLRKKKKKTNNGNKK